MNRHSLLHEDMVHFFRNYPENAHPMAVLSAMVARSPFYPEPRGGGRRAMVDAMVARLLSKLRTIAAFSYKKSIGQPFIYPRTTTSATAPTSCT
jgi:citrate synthase